MKPLSAERSVAFAMEWIPQYRQPFYDALSRELEEREIRLLVTHGDPPPNRVRRRDAAEPAWTNSTPNRRWQLGGTTLTWQPVAREVADYGLVVFQQESSLLLNYRALLTRRFRERRIALWGHGENPNPATRSRSGEILKSWMTRQADWFFAYTDRSGELAGRCGVPPDRITVVNNSQAPPDPTGRADPLLTDLAAAVRSRTRHIGWMTSALDDYKRLSFLVDVLDAIRSRVPDFEFFVLGRGALEDTIFDAASTRPWLHAVGARTGADKSVIGEIAQVTVHPGLIGLHVVDAFNFEAPVITPDLDYHSHEVEYLEPGNAVVLASSVNADNYATAVAEVLTDHRRLSTLQTGCRAAARTYSLSNMVQRFSAGIERALDAAPRQPR